MSDSTSIHDQITDAMSDLEQHLDRHPVDRHTRAKINKVINLLDELDWIVEELKK